jgi:hypothetical protein
VNLGADAQVESERLHDVGGRAGREHVCGREHASSIRSPPIFSVGRSWNVSSGGGLVASSSRSRSFRVSSFPIRAMFLLNSENAPA